MNWQNLLEQAIVTGGGLGVAWIGLRTKLVEVHTSLQRSVAASQAAETMASTAMTAATKTEQSINNRPMSASDRWDAIHGDVEKIHHLQITMARGLQTVTEDVRLLREDQELVQKDVTRLRNDDRALKRETRTVRRELADHIEALDPIAPMVSDLHTKYVPEAEGESNE